MQPEFVHLSVHSEFSLSQGIVRIDQLLEEAKKRELPALAITDHSNMFGWVRFYMGAIKNGIKPIFGMEIDLEGTSVTKKSNKICLYCCNKKGYQNLCFLISHAYARANGGAPKLDFPTLKRHAEGLIALSGGQHSAIGRYLNHDDYDLAKKESHQMREIFGDRFYLHIHRVGFRHEENFVQKSIDLATDLDIPCVASNLVNFLSQKELKLHLIRNCIHESKILDDSIRKGNISTDQQYLKSTCEMSQLFADFPQVISNTVEIAKRCNFHMQLEESLLPSFPLPEGQSEIQFLRNKAKAGLERCLKESSIDKPEQIKVYEERLKYELSVIIDMGFPGYFLIVSDFTTWAYEHGIPVGPGRGSGAGSLAAWCLGICDLDPIRYGLLFERFLNPDRSGLPDFDIDFCIERRDDVIAYVQNRYGIDRVGQIVTFSTLKARAAIRDIGRVMNLPQGLVDRIAKLVPGRPDITLTTAIQEVPEIEKTAKEEHVEELIEFALKLEGLPRNAGVHAGGVVIAPVPLVQTQGMMQENAQSMQITQFDKDDLKKIGLVKFDFLGVKSLTTIHNCVESINRNKESDPFDIRKVPLDSKAVYAMLSEGQSLGVFQMDSTGMRRLLKMLKPDRIEDLIALVALHRPGPLGSNMHVTYVRRKHKKEKVAYPDERLIPILQETYGVILFQEQVMQIARSLANYSAADADRFRQFMSSKDDEKMAKERNRFIKGASENGMQQDKAQTIFDLIEQFAGYGFNKSHSTAYALISYRTAYLKRHYSAQYLAALMSSEMSQQERFRPNYLECKSWQISLNLPCVNKSLYDFEAISEHEVQFGFGGIMGLGRATAFRIIEEREQNKEYKSLLDFCVRMRKKYLGSGNKGIRRSELEILIHSGAFDCFGNPRKQLTETLSDALSWASQQSNEKVMGQGALLSLENEKPMRIPAPAVPSEQSTGPESMNLMRLEKKTIGLYLSAHPLDSVKEERIEAGLRSLKECAESSGREEYYLVQAIKSQVIQVYRRRQGRIVPLVILQDKEYDLEATLLPDCDLSRLRMVENEQPLVVLLKNAQYSSDRSSHQRFLNLQFAAFYYWHKLRQKCVSRIELELSIDGARDKNVVDFLIESAKKEKANNANQTGTQVTVRLPTQAGIAILKSNDLNGLELTQQVHQTFNEWKQQGLIRTYTRIWDANSLDLIQRAAHKSVSGSKISAAATSG